MAVRTEKIQALTGSAPLTLPTSLPASSKGVEVSTTGVISTPATADSLTHLTSSTDSDPGWVLLDHVEQNSATSIMSVRNTSTTYPASDIYCYELHFNIMGYYNNTGSDVRWSPTRNGTRAPNGNGRYSVGCWQSVDSGKSHFSISSNATNSTGGYEMTTEYKMNTQTSPTGNTYTKMFDKSAASKSNNFGGDGGVQGRMRYYNGSGYAGPVIDEMGWNGRRGTGNSYGNWQMNRSGFSMPVSNNATHTGKVDGFDCWDTHGGTWGNASYKIMGFIQLWGMPKTAS